MTIITAKVISGPVVSEMKDIDRRSDRATMWALREVGRDVKKLSRREAPVYHGRRQMSRTELNRRIKARKEGDYKKGYAEGNRVVTGLLRSSISSSRRLRKSGHEYSLKVGPRGWRVHLYAGKIEEKQPYMKPGYAAAEAAMRSTFERGWAKAMR